MPPLHDNDVTVTQSSSSSLFASDHKIHRKYHENKMNKKEEKERK